MAMERKTCQIHPANCEPPVQKPTSEAPTPCPSTLHKLTSLIGTATSHAASRAQAQAWKCLEGAGASFFMAFIPGAHTHTYTYIYIYNIHIHTHVRKQLTHTHTHTHKHCTHTSANNDARLLTCDAGSQPKRGTIMSGLIFVIMQWALDHQCRTRAIGPFKSEDLCR